MASLVWSHPAAGQAPGAQAALVRLPFPQDDGSLTPYTFELGYSLMTLVYDTLLWRDKDGVPQPWLAKAVETSADGRRVTLRLADGVKWHDGTTLTSADVSFTFQFVAAHPHPRFTAEVSSVERVETPDPTTAVVVLRQPSPGFLDQPLADLPILPQHVWRNLAPGTLAPEGLPVGSGPYRLVEHRPRELYRFEANNEYFRGRPAVGVLEVPVIDSPGETVDALARRKVDVIPVSLPEDLAKRADALSVEVEEGTSYLGTVVMFNLRSPPFDRGEVRQAVSAALDLTRITRAVGNAVPADRGYLHPESPFASQDPLHRHDAAAARAVLGGLAEP
ncbi:MAG: ABC transporter substrate-binding protein, partial [Actinomycetota bacterium]|nr:ABC transporter substrate-binding protein [Actinomycetota bacterium]